MEGNVFSSTMSRIRQNFTVKKLIILICTAVFIAADIFLITNLLKPYIPKGLKFSAVEDMYYYTDGIYLVDDNIVVLQKDQIYTCSVDTDGEFDMHISDEEFKKYYEKAGEKSNGTYIESICALPDEYISHDYIGVNIEKGYILEDERKNAKIMFVVTGEGKLCGINGENDGYPIKRMTGHELWELGLPISKTISNYRTFLKDRGKIYNENLKNNDATLSIGTLSSMASRISKLYSRNGVSISNWETVPGTNDDCKQYGKHCLYSLSDDNFTFVYYNITVIIMYNGNQFESALITDSQANYYYSSSGISIYDIMDAILNPCPGPSVYYAKELKSMAEYHSNNCNFEKTTGHMKYHVYEGSDDSYISIMAN